MSTARKPSNRALVAEIRRQVPELPTESLYRLEALLEAILAKNRPSEADYLRLRRAARLAKTDQ